MCVCVGGSYPSVEVQLVHSTAPADWAISLVSVEFLMRVGSAFGRMKVFLFLIYFLPVSGCLPRQAPCHSLFS